MNDIERIKKAIRLIAKESLGKQSVERIDDILNQPIEPTQPEGYQGLNKWYLANGGSVLFINTEDELEVFGGYGYFSELKWCESLDLCSREGLIRLATESEIKEAILKGCEQKGIVEGARVKCLSTGNEIILTEFYDVVITNDLNSVWIYPQMDVLVKVFDNGKFAEVVKDFNCEDGNCTKQCDNCKSSFNQADKELLKECNELLYNLYNGIWNGEKISPMLTKLNKHLNHD